MTTLSTDPILSENSLTVLKTRYLQPGETPAERFRAVAKHIASAEKTEEEKNFWEGKFYELLCSLNFLPNSPVLFNAGTGSGCLSACFCLSPEDSMESIMKIATDSTMIQKWGGGVGHGLSLIRRKGASIKSTQKYALGPLGVLRILSSVSKEITQGGRRNGANMGQLSDSHPDLYSFIHSKDNDNEFDNFNISVQLSEKFMKSVKDNKDWDLIDPHDKTVIQTVKARDLWNEIIKSAWKTGDPGIVFIDRVNDSAPNPSLGPILTSNPCAEQFLEDYNNCCLGSISVHHFIENNEINWNKLEETINLSVRFLDNVIEVNEFPLPKLREVNLLTRRIGLGIMGWADLLILLKYSL